MVSRLEIVDAESSIGLGTRPLNCGSAECTLASQKRTSIGSSVDSGVFVKFKSIVSTSAHSFYSIVLKMRFKRQPTCEDGFLVLPRGSSRSILPIVRRYGRIAQVRAGNLDDLVRAEAVALRRHLARDSTADTKPAQNRMLHDRTSSSTNNSSTSSTSRELQSKTILLFLRRIRAAHDSKAREVKAVLLQIQHPARKLV
jgi:hypothetical protein